MMLSLVEGLLSGFSLPRCGASCGICLVLSMRPRLTVPSLHAALPAHLVIRRRSWKCKLGARRKAALMTGRKKSHPCKIRMPDARKAPLRSDLFLL